MLCVERSANKRTVEPKRCLLLGVRTSSLEVDLRVPGNREEFPFSQAEWSLPSYFPPFVRSRESPVTASENLSSQKDLNHPLHPLLPTRLDDT